MRTLLSFSAPVSYPVASEPQLVAVGDFNGDHKLDTVSVGGGAVSVLLGNGDGSFQAARSSAGSPQPKSVAVGDFNADGKLDLVTANATDLSVLLGKGDGTFQSPRSLTLGSSPVSVAVGDFNADGKLDLVATSYTAQYKKAPYSKGGGGYVYTGYVNVILGHGDGAFGPLTKSGKNTVVQVPAGVPGSAVVGDFNGDGKLDAAVSGNSAVIVLLGNGDLTLQPPATFAAGGPPVALAAADFNHDGHLDLAAAVTVTTGNPPGVGILLGNGNGTFAKPNVVTFASGDPDPTFPLAVPAGLAVGDVNADGQLDLVLTSVYDCEWGPGWYRTHGPINPVQVITVEGRGDGTFTGQVAVPLSGNLGPVVAGNFNSDGFADLALAGYSPSAVSVLINDGRWPTVSLAAAVATASPASAPTALGPMVAVGVDDTSSVGDTFATSTLGPDRRRDR